MLTYTDTQIVRGRIVTMSKSKNPYYTELRKEYPRTWRIWYRMNKRCQYGQQGTYVDVEVCDDWNIQVEGEQAFINFVDDMGPSELALEIDRKDPFGDYERSNCRWVQPRVNRYNTRKRVSGAYNNIELAKKNGINRYTYYARIRRGWDSRDAATLPTSQKKYKKRIV